jgi:protein-disulfide isomerase
MLKILAALSVFLALASAGSAQILGTGLHDNFRDKSVLQPPAGSPVAIIVFEDLGCPACAHDHAIEADAAAKAHVPLIRYDFPIPNHIWTFQAAVCARYVQETLKNPSLAEQYRADVFKIQAQISNKDDLQNFTTRWLRQHGQQPPFVMDPSGNLEKAVKADFDRGMRLNVEYTPTIVVVTKHNYQMICGAHDGNDPSKILPVAEAALAQAKSAPARPRAAR